FHNTRDCLKLKRREVRQNEEEKKFEDDKPHKGFVIYDEKLNTCREIQLSARIGETNINCLFDTGSYENLISSKLVDLIKLKPEKLREQKTILMANSASEKITEFVSFNLSFKQIPNQEFSIKCLILNNLPIDLNIGYNFMKKHNLIINTKEDTLIINDQVIEYNEYSVEDKMEKQINEYVLDKTMLTVPGEIEMLLKETKKLYLQ
ncbi:hypothetical protein H311_03950, partial [Anncaliia algerae PRA109]